MDSAFDDLSERLRAFVASNPRVRGPHVVFLRREATDIPAGSSVLDVGAGIAPFRELFDHTRYVTCDWEGSSYDQDVDIRAPATAIPVEDGSFDVVLCTEVLEHVPEPSLVLTEFSRILRRGGLLLMTVPLVWFLHEEPYDYYRYTPHGLRFLLEGAGFAELEIVPSGDAFSTLAELVANLGWMIGADEDPADQHKAEVAQKMRELAEVIQSYSDADTRWILPLGYAVTARRP
jgi:SAM-dependent methyltransferase